MNLFVRHGPTEPEAPKRAVRPLHAGQLEAVRRVGPAAVAGMNPEATHPNMQPSGSARPLLYVLGEAPGEQEDLRGEPFVGPSGEFLRSRLRSAVLRETRFDNVCRTRPPKNRDPTDVELAAFRDAVEHSIEEARPRAVLGTGKLPLQWMLGLDSIKAARGRMFPVRVRSHACWFFPVLHPAHVLRLRSEEVEEDKVPPKEWVRFFELDLDHACDLLPVLVPPWVPDPSRADEGVQCLQDPRRVEAELLKVLQGPPQVLAVDLETTALRPYVRGARIVSVALGWLDRAVAFPLEGPEPEWRSSVRPLLAQLLAAPHVRLVAHNAPFELEWMFKVFWDDALPGKSLGRWECTQQAAYVLDCRNKGLSLDFQCKLELGLPLKSLSPDVDRAAVTSTPLPRLLRYNGLDALWTRRLHEVLSKKVEGAGLRQSYQRQLDRMVPVVVAQLQGMPTNVEVTRRLAAAFDAREREVDAKIRVDPDVLQFEAARRRTFNVQSNPDVVELLRDDLKCEEGWVRKRGKKDESYTTAEGVLAVVAKRHPIARLILDRREVTKQSTTYVRRFLPEHLETYLYPDGRLHTHFSISYTATTRLSSEEPNQQNWPARENPEVRDQLEAPPGWSWLSVDEAQIEARVIGMESEDPRWVKAIREGYDVHMEWAEKVARADHRTLLRQGGNLKKLRREVKNMLVFPAFYGASVRAIAIYLGVELSVAEALMEEFWDFFSGVAAWQRRELAKYRVQGGVWSLTGRWRPGPLSQNQVFNSPTQTTANDIVCDAWRRIVTVACERMAWHYAPVLNVHDDLTFLVPDSELEEVANVAIDECLTFDAPWRNVPLSVEVKRGRRLRDMEPLGTFVGLN